MQKTSERIMAVMRNDGKRFFSNDNVSTFLTDEDIAALKQEATEAFEHVMDAFLIDWRSDPNAMGTPKRLAKMYFNEIMSGRYFPMPDMASFPNDGSDGQEPYDGMLVVRAEIKSLCSHHWQPVDGLCFIGIIPQDKVIGLSKYIRIAQWVSQRGTLQEQLCMDIAKEIQSATGSPDIAVYIQARHGCCENRGVQATNSMTQTTYLMGKFKESLSTKQEFTDNVKLQLTYRG